MNGTLFLFGKISTPILILDAILIVILVAMVGNEVWLQIQGRRASTLVGEDEFKTGMHKGQVIDVREKEAFDAGHILGARNLPYSMLKTSITSLRKDQPIYLYDQKKTMSIRTAVKLRKNGYQDIYVLKKGYDGWTGKIKKKTV